MRVGGKINSLGGATIKGKNNEKRVAVYHPHVGVICHVEFQKEFVTMDFVKSVKAALQAMAQMETEQEEKKGKV